MQAMADPTRQRQQGVQRAAAGGLDFFRGMRMQNQAEGNIEDIGAQIDEIQGRMDEMAPPSLMGDEALAAATRNAAILGQNFQQDPSAELAAAQTAIESGADPATVARMQAEAQAREQQQGQQQAQQAFQQGLGMAQQDVMNQYQIQQQGMQNEMDAALQQLQAAQQESLMGQQLRGQGAQSALRGLTQFAGNFEKNLADVKDDQGNILQEATGLQNFAANLGLKPQVAARGMSVQKTPGEYSHETNDMILVSQAEDGSLIDTGNRLTGGEFVIDPFNAGEMRQSHEKIDPVELEKVRQGEMEMSEEMAESLMRLYDAVRFIDEPQFQDEYQA